MKKAKEEANQNSALQLPREESLRREAKRRWEGWMEICEVSGMNGKTRARRQLYTRGRAITCY